jgi:hypothetical protein
LVRDYAHHVVRVYDPDNLWLGSLPKVGNVQDGAGGIDLIHHGQVRPATWNTMMAQIHVKKTFGLNKQKSFGSVIKLASLISKKVKKIHNFNDLLQYGTVRTGTYLTT